MMKKINLFILIFIVLISGFSNIWAQESEQTTSLPKSYSLDDLYRMALKRSDKIKISNEDLYIAEQTKKKALSVLVPRFSAFGNYTRYSEEKTAPDKVTPIQPESTTAWGVRFDQSFTLNGKELIALEITKDSIKKSEYDLNAVKEAYLFTVASAYYNILKTSKAVEIAKANVERLETHKNAVTVQLNIEAATKTDLFRAQAELSKSRTELINATNGLKLARIVLSRVVGLEGNFEIKKPELNKSFSLGNDMDSLKKEALSDRAELKSLAVQKKISEDMVKFSKSAYWPTVSVEGVYQKYDQEPDSFMVNDESLSLGVMLNFTIFDGGLRRAEIKESIAKMKQAELAEKDLSKDIATEVEDAYLFWLTQMSVLNSLEDQVKFANSNYDAVSKQFKYGFANSVDVVDANTLLVTSETELSEAIYNGQLAGLGVERAKGTFLKTITDRLETKTER
ncbi:MAG: TolC family protein [Deltaproteobacteria bacterium]|nr:TolC family protein [Deltaproteobacteria bacterium]